ncbi:MinD/ParA family protein [Williamsia sp.]|uniref:MinD/ParA family ATP-binding protein n=1 Tax=Williamsia sp. TaxID=1872085 RepID=UPI002F93D9A2
MSYNNADVPAAPPWLQSAADIDVASFERANQPPPAAESSGVPAAPPVPEPPAAPDARGPVPPQSAPPQPPHEQFRQPSAHAFTPPPAQQPSTQSYPADPNPHGANSLHPGNSPYVDDPSMHGHPAAGVPQHDAPAPGSPPPGYFPGQAVPPPHYAPGQPPAPAPTSLDEVALLRKARRAPASGWRRTVHKLSAGTINPGESPDDLVYKQLLERVNQPVRGDYRIAVLSLKGGVGKTTTTVGLGSTFASLRGDRVIAVDANPDLGTLAQRIPQQTRSTVRDLLADESIYRYSDVRAHTSQAPSRLEILASERDPAKAEAFSEADYRGVMTVLQRFYNIIITDCGTGLSHSAMNGVLDMANSLILVTSPAIDGARSAGATLDWLQAHGFGHLVSGAVVVLSSSRPGASTIDTDQLSAHFLTRCRAVQQIPFDDHLAEGAEVDLDLLGKSTRRALVEMAATVADDFPSTTMRRGDPYYTS